MKSNSFCLTKLPIKTSGLTIILLLFLIGIAEWISRLEIIQAPLTAPKMGSQHYQLGDKLTYLNAYIKQYGSIDCIMVGSSMVDVGFDPDAFQKGYLEVTGRNIHCFNFGVDASAATSTAALAQILIEDYQPCLLIFGTDARDYAIANTEPGPAVIMETTWVQYRMGDFSVDGWLLDHSYFYRYRQHFSQLARFNYEDTLRSHTKTNFEILPNGWTPLTKVGTHINNPPNPQDDSYEVQTNTRLYSSYKLLDENLNALESILDLSKSGTNVLVVEMPISDGLYYFFGNGKEDYNYFFTRVSDIAKLHQVPFLRTEPLDFISDNGWVDYSHLNTTGAEIFSTWLGQQVGKADVQKKICFSNNNMNSSIV